MTEVTQAGIANRDLVIKRSENEALIDKIRKLEAEAAKQDAANKEIEKEIRVAEGKVMALNKEVEMYGLEAKEKEINELSQEEKAYKEREKEIRNKISELQTEFEKKLDEEKQVELSLIESYKKYEVKTNEITSLDSEIASKNLKISQFQIEIQDLDEKIQEINYCISLKQEEYSKEASILQEITAQLNQKAIEKSKWSEIKDQHEYRLEQLKELERLEIEGSPARKFDSEQKEREIERRKEEINQLRFQSEKKVEWKKRELDDTVKKANQNEEASRILEYSPRRRSPSPRSKTPKPMGVVNYEAKIRDLKMKIDTTKKTRREYEEKMKEEENMLTDAIMSASASKHKGFLICAVGFAFGIIFFKLISTMISLPAR